MKEIVRAVIDSKNFELSDMLKKIDRLWLEGKLSEMDKESLIFAARENASPADSVDLLKKVAELEQRVKALEDAKNADSGTDGETDGEAAESSDSGSSEATVAYPEYVPGKWYYNGDKISFDGADYTCIAPVGAVCTWNPDEYPAYWEVIPDESDGSLI